MFNTKFSKEYYLRTSDFDSRSRLLPSAILDLFQEAAGTHAEELGIGAEQMNANNVMWVLMRVKYEVLEDAHPHTSVIVNTWPLVPTRLGFQREYLIESTEGKTLVKGTSEWVLVHTEKRKAVAVKDVYPFSEGFETQTVFEEKTTKLHNFTPVSDGMIVVPGYSQIDVNGHVNNTKYANYILDILSPAEDESVCAFQIDYRKEVLADMPVTLFCTREDGEAFVKGVNSDGENMFLCKMTLK
ncbi:MAG: hypothetical protein IJO96_07375 [Oscillospiraceae bacterium]|nr:hypothetical protein [Oscillospiraceae bacterium]